MSICECRCGCKPRCDGRLDANQRLLPHELAGQMRREGRRHVLGHQRTGGPAEAQVYAEAQTTK